MQRKSSKFINLKNNESMNIPKQREIFKLGFQIQICQPKKGKNANIITTNTGSISNKYSIYDQFAHGVPKKKKKKKQISFPTNNSHSQSKNRRLG